MAMRIWSHHRWYLTAEQQLGRFQQSVRHGVKTPGPHLLYQEGRTPNRALLSQLGGRPGTHRAGTTLPPTWVDARCLLSWKISISLPCDSNKITFKSYYSEGLIFYGPTEAVGGTLIEFPLLVKLVLQLNLSGKELSFISVDSMILLSLIRHFFGKEKSSNNPTWESCRLGPGFSSSADTDLIKHGNLKFRLSSRRDI